MIREGLVEGTVGMVLVDIYTMEGCIYEGCIVQQTSEEGLWCMHPVI